MEWFCGTRTAPGQSGCCAETLEEAAMLWRTPRALQFKGPSSQTLTTLIAYPSNILSFAGAGVHSFACCLSMEIAGLQHLNVIDMAEELAVYFCQCSVFRNNSGSFHLLLKF